MALDSYDASQFAQKLLLNMAESGSLQTVGPNIGPAINEDNSLKKGRCDALYLATLYHEIVKELQK